MAITVYPAPVASSKVQKIVTITSTQSWTVPAGVNEIELLLCGGGGGGGAGVNAGGGSGSAWYTMLTVTPGTAYTVTIGGGGAGGDFGTNNAGSNGTTSSFGALFTATGGTGGSQQGAPGSRFGGHGGACMPENLNSGVTGKGGDGGIGFMGFGGGGGGGVASSSGIRLGAIGQNGGGRSFGANNSGQLGVTNSGGGGGGGGFNGTYWNGGQGGSGVAVIKYWI